MVAWMWALGDNNSVQISGFDDGEMRYPSLKWIKKKWEGVLDFPEEMNDFYI